MYDKIVTVKRYITTLGEYNRPKKTIETVGEFPCHISESSTSTAQQQVQKETTTQLNLYTEPEAPIQKGDVLYIYEMDEYDKPILSSEFKALADQPYKKRTQLKVSLLSDEEV